MEFWKNRKKLISVLRDLIKTKVIENALCSASQIQIYSFPFYINFIIILFIDFLDRNQFYKKLKMLANEVVSLLSLMPLRITDFWNEILYSNRNLKLLLFSVNHRCDKNQCPCFDSCSFTFKWYLLKSFHIQCSF